jgi:hypothetical protein
LFACEADEVWADSARPAAAFASAVQTAGVLASLGLVAKCFRLLPEKNETDRTWNARSWSKERKGWIFITSRPPERETLRPLYSLWIDLLVMRLLTAPQPGQKPVWFVIDKLASLQKLPQFHIAITENRKSKNPPVLGFQGKAQLEVTYGHLVEVMLSQPATKIFMKTAEPKAAEWISEAIGKVEIERLKETKFDGSRSGKTVCTDKHCPVHDPQAEAEAAAHPVPAMAPAPEAETEEEAAEREAEFERQRAKFEEERQRREEERQRRFEQEQAEYETEQLRRDELRKARAGIL